MPGNRWTARAAAGIALLAAACAPVVETPAEAGRRRDARDAAALVAMLRRLPSVVEAHVTLTRPVSEPLGGERVARAGAAAVLLVYDPPSAPAALETDARALVAASAPELSPERITVVTREQRMAPRLAALGPFTVARSSRAPLLASLVGLLLACAALAAALVWRERSRQAPR